MQTETHEAETRNPWVGWNFTSRHALSVALDQYASFRGEAAARAGV